jgi:hypothetical protein
VERRGEEINDHRRKEETKPALSSSEEMIVDDAMRKFTQHRHASSPHGGRDYHQGSYVWWVCFCILRIYVVL